MCTYVARSMCAGVFIWPVSLHLSHDTCFRISLDASKFKRRPTVQQCTQQQLRYSPITLVGTICEMDAVDTNRVIDLSANDNIPLPAASAPMALSTGTSEPKQPPALGVNVDAPIANEPGRLITPVDADALIDSAIGMYDSSNYRRHDLIVSTQSRWRQVCDLSSPQQSN